jgi:hypothetical protein
MKIEGESWEKWLYPLMQRPLPHCIRRALPLGLLVQAIKGWLSFSGSVYATPYFQVVERARQAVLPVRRRKDFLSAHLTYVITFYLEMARMMDETRDCIKRRIRSTLRLEVGGLLEAIRAGRGVLVPTVQSNVPVRVFFAGLPGFTTFHAVLHTLHPGISRVLAKADPCWRFITLDCLPGRGILSALRRGEVVVCNIDHAYPGTEVTLAPVLGRPAIVPSGVFRIARRCGSPVVPLTIVSQKSGHLVAARQRLDWDDVTGEQLPVARMLERAQRILDSAILHAPAEWMGWGNLSHRWTAWRVHGRR